MCSIGFDLYSSQHQEGLRLHMHEVSGLAMSIFSEPSLHILSSIVLHDIEQQIITKDKESDMYCSF